MASSVPSSKLQPVSFDQELLTAQVSELHANIPIALISAIVLGGMLVLFQLDTPLWNNAITWYSVFTVVVVINVIYWFRHRTVPIQNAKTNLHILRWSSLVRGIIWGSAVWFFLPEKTNEITDEILFSEIITLMVLSGVAAGGASTYSADLRTALGFSSLVLIQVLLYFTFMEYVIPCVITLFFIVFLLRAAMSSHNRFKNILQLRIDAEYREVLLRDALERAEESDKVKDEFLANVSHELRTPLHAIIGTSEILSSTELDEDQKSLLNGMQGSSDQLLTLLNDLLDLSRIEAGYTDFISAPMSLRNILKILESTYQPQASAKDLQLSYDIEDKIPEILYGDGNRLNQILSNLVSNAIKYTDEGGVEISVRLESDKSTETRVKFIVKDTGIGIASEDIEKIFNKFHRVATIDMQGRGGTGLGLPIVKRLVELQGGTMENTSMENEGSSFSFILPFRKSPAKQKPSNKNTKKSNTPKPVSSRNIQILLVDDVSMNLTVSTRQIKKLWPNAEIVTAENGREAIDKIKSSADNPFDIVLMDVRMPVMDGYAATAAIRQLPSPLDETKVIAVSAGMLSDKQKEDAGFSSVLMKPYAPAKLQEIVNGLL